MRATFRPVSARGEDQHDSPSGTLGDLLYPGNAKPVVSESEWDALIKAIAAGDQRALRSLYERTHRIVYTLIVRITNDRQTAEELTLDVFHDVWQRASKYDPAGGTVIGWLMNQARCRAIDRWRFERRKKRVNPQAHDPLQVPARSGTLETVDVYEQGRVLRDTLAILTPHERQAIETAFFSDMTYAEVAAKLDQPLGTIKTRIRSGLGKLRQAMTGTGIEP
jgi:RNA polymerase sigma-70 factor, ECF subfamily